MKQITVNYHEEDGLWWAESPSLPGFSSAADSLKELRALTKEGVKLALDGAPHMILEVPPFGIRGGSKDAQRSQESTRQVVFSHGHSYSFKSMLGVLESTST